MMGNRMHRPSFSACWSAAQRIYEPSNPGEKVARVIGGRVAFNILEVDRPFRWRNTCAVRMSYILNHCGVLIPAVPDITVSGADHRQYFFRIENLQAFLLQRWGQPEVNLKSPLSRRHLQQRKGILFFGVSGWIDASGHVTLFDGHDCYDQCYFNNASIGSYQARQASFWGLG